jgi:hypothetical protein
MHESHLNHCCNSDSSRVWIDDLHDTRRSNGGINGIGSQECLFTCNDGPESDDLRLYIQQATRCLRCSIGRRSRNRGIRFQYSVQDCATCLGGSWWRTHLPKGLCTYALNDMHPTHSGSSTSRVHLFVVLVIPILKCTFPRAWALDLLAAKGMSNTFEPMV